MSKVSIIKTPNYDLNTVKIAIEKHFEQLELDKLFKKGMRVTLKPNLLMKRKPESGTTTHPVLLEAVIIKLKELDITDITIADSPGGLYTKNTLKGIYETCGMADTARRHDVKLNFDVGSSEMICPNPKITNKFNIINPLADTDIIINLPKLKTHSLTGISAGIKNMFGAIPGLMKPEMHFRFKDHKNFSDMLIDLVLTVPPTVTICDAVTAMEGDGPSSGVLRDVGYTYACVDVFALDLVLCNVIGQKAENIPMLKREIERGLSSGKLSEIELVGDELVCFDDYKLPKSRSIDFVGSTPLPKFIEKWLGSIFTPKLKVIKKSCIGCGKCAESCPAKIISMVNKKAIINYTKCIKCYCCHEMCPVKAIIIKRNKLFNR